MTARTIISTSFLIRKVFQF